MKIYYTIRNYSRIFLQKKPFKQKILSGINNSMLEMSTTELNKTMSEESILISLDNLKVQYKNQFTCLLTRCVFCNNICLYINKMTGKHLKKNYLIIDLNIWSDFCIKFFRLVYLYSLFEVRRLVNI